MAKRQMLANDATVSEPPFWGPRIIEQVSLPVLLPYLNERMLYQFQWGYRKDGRRLDEYMDWAQHELRPILNRITDVAVPQGILNPQAAYGYWKAAGEGDDLVLYDKDGATDADELAAGTDPKALRDARPYQVEWPPAGRG